MKKIILFAAVLMITCLTSCNVTPSDVIKADFMYAFTDYECRESEINYEYINKIYESHGEYIPDADELCDSLTAIFEKNTSECFDSLYIKYGNETVRRMVYLKEKVDIENKETLYKYYVNKSVYKIMQDITLQIKTQSILALSENTSRMKK
jgi:hypothetical protein